MPKLSIFLTDDVFKLVEKEIEENGNPNSKHNTSAAISRLIVRGSPYELITRETTLRKKKKVRNG